MSHFGQIRGGGSFWPDGEGVGGGGGGAQTDLRSEPLWSDIFITKNR